jgi:cell division protein FtsB
MRWLTLVLAALVLLLQYPLWLGKGGWFKAWEYERQLEQFKQANQKLEVRNSGLDAEVRDLKQGYDAIEERARYELGLIKEGEVFVQFPEAAQGPAQSSGEAKSGAEPTSDKPGGKPALR